jgi:hypothetical protein
MSSSGSDRDGAVEQAVQTAAGVADLLASFAVRQAKRVVAPARDVVMRSDLRELTREGHSDLRARGALALQRRLPDADPPHLETLAQRAKRAR